MRFPDYDRDRRVFVETPPARVWLRPADLTPAQIAYTDSLPVVQPRQGSAR